jgi:hypothetical protein
MAIVEKKGRFLQKPFWSDLEEHHRTWNRNAENLYAEYREEECVQMEGNRTLAIRQRVKTCSKKKKKKSSWQMRRRAISPNRFNNATG